MISSALDLVAIVISSASELVAIVISSAPELVAIVTSDTAGVQSSRPACPAFLVAAMISAMEVDKVAGVVHVYTCACVCVL